MISQNKIKTFICIKLIMIHSKLGLMIDSSINLFKLTLY